ncbi:aspartate/glutamate racemase family protein [Accumulibacter sp.]|uniref:aspartate/glutamate racemase family protein n=1 Tax=Accumulibacter sp. TaxID=2053492 RepID=UPI0026294D51|nr:aspartate/glutamate racemase family protein [Accumulibacter sp.]
MKTIGLLGGMSWESTVPYYRRINERVRQRLGGLHSARLLLYSVDFAEIERLQREARWCEAGTLLAVAARSLEAAGADLLLLCTNTMHKVAPAIEAAVSIPLLHIADPTAARIRQLGLRTVGLLGTRFTMEQDFYRARLESVHGLRVVIPEFDDREQVHRVIYEELCLGVVAEDSRRAYRAVIGRLAQRGAQGIILGCTEIALLISPADTPIPLFDTTLIHADSAVDLALSGA